MKSVLYLLAAIFHLVLCQDTPQDNVTDSTIITDTSTVETTTSIPIYFLSDDNRVVSWSPRSTQSIIIEAPEGFKISVNVTECNIDGENGDYAAITPDTNINGLMFTYSVARQPAYLYNNQILYGDFVGTNSSNFTVVFTRIGEGLTTTTTEVPTTTVILPSPSPEDSSTLLVYLSGLPFSAYSDSSNPEPLNDLRNAIVLMAQRYCENENFPLNGSITSSNVIFNSLMPCTSGWPNHQTCVQLNFSVPVHLIEDSTSIWSGYQMTTAHMRIMWSRYATTYLPANTNIYTPPGDKSLIWGISLLVSGTVVFALLLLAIRHYGMKVSKLVSRQRKLSDTTSIISASDRNNSQISLPPHYLQDTPALFENAYPMYNPDKSPEYSEPAYAKSFDYPVYRDLSVDLQKQADEDEVEESGA